MIGPIRNIVGDPKTVNPFPESADAISSQSSVPDVVGLVPTALSEVGLCRCSTPVNSVVFCPMLICGSQCDPLNVPRSVAIQPSCL